MSCGVRKLPIAGLTPDVNNALIIAVMVARHSPRLFLSKKNFEERGVWNFTLKDSPSDSINASIWGSSEFIQQTFEIFSIGDVVEILNPKISFKPGSADATFNPYVSSPFQLHLQEKSSNILLYVEDDVEYYRQFIHFPTKASGDFLRLSDIFSYGQAMKGEFVNLLVAVRHVGEVRQVKSKKDSKDLLCRHITLMDESHLEFHMTLWNSDIIKRSDHWRARQTIIFFADVRLEWDNFRSSITANITSRTIVTENPKITEALSLQEYAETAPIQPVAVLDYFAHQVIDASTINQVMTTAQVLDKAFSRNNVDQFTALLYATITHLDLDGNEPVISYNCSKCSQPLDNSRSCLNADCLTSGKKDLSNPKISFKIQVNLSDHRGTLYNCRLVSPTADEILGCSPDLFAKLSIEEKTELKWQFLLTRCEVRILVLCTSPERPQPLVSIVACKPASWKDVATKLPFY